MLTSALNAYDVCSHARCTSAGDHCALIVTARQAAKERAQDRRFAHMHEPHLMFTCTHATEGCIGTCASSKRSGTFLTACCCARARPCIGPPVGARAAPAQEHTHERPSLIASEEWTHHAILMRLQSCRRLSIEFKNACKCASVQVNKCMHMYVYVCAHASTHACGIRMLITYACECTKHACIAHRVHKERYSGKGRMLV
eukprot:1014293-Pleurochrysis_carterae.AAC.3